METSTGVRKRIVPFSGPLRRKVKSRKTKKGPFWDP
jgi:hypothetical protein